MPFPREFQAARASGTSLETRNCGGGDGERPLERRQYPNSAANSNVSCKIEMLTPKGEHSFPCSTRVMFDGRISFDGIATVKTL